MSSPSTTGRGRHESFLHTISGDKSAIPASIFAFFCGTISLPQVVELIKTRHSHDDKAIQLAYPVSQQRCLDKCSLPGDMTASESFDNRHDYCWPVSERLLICPGGCEISVVNKDEHSLKEPDMPKVLE